MAIKVLGKVMPQSSMPTAATLQTTTGQMSAIDEGASSEDDISDDEGLLNEDMALTVKTLEREVRSLAHLQSQLCLKACSGWQHASSVICQHNDAWRACSWQATCFAIHLQAPSCLKPCSWQHTGTITIVLFMPDCQLQALWRWPPSPAANPVLSRLSGPQLLHVT